MNVASLTIAVRITVSDRRVTLWRLRALGFVAWLLGVPLTLEES